MIRTTLPVRAVAAFVLVMLLAVPALCGETAPERKPPAGLKGRSCTEADCHGALKKAKYTHGPVAIDACASCHKTRDEAKHKFVLSHPLEELCSACHLKTARRKVKHGPVEEGMCTACHDPHGSRNEFLLTAAEIGDLCGECHDSDEITGKKKYVHAPVEAGACDACHEPHDSDFAKLLKGGEREACGLCHDEITAGTKGHKSVHKPVEEGCLGCHRGHSSEQPKLLAAAKPALCYNCHEDKKTMAEADAITHEAVLKDHGCDKCHLPHSSKVARLGRKPHVELCSDCHGKTILFNGKVAPDIKKTITGPKFKHGPVQEGNCSGCHDLHGPQKSRLLARNYTADFYASFDVKEYALCFDCHDSKMVLTVETETATGFRDGTRNLHYVHVNKERKGRTCRACHAAHATDLSKMVRKSVPFGEWQLPVGFSQTETGGKCESGCHLPKRYDRSESAGASVPVTAPPEEKDGAGEGKQGDAKKTF